MPSVLAAQASLGRRWPAWKPGRSGPEAPSPVTEGAVSGVPFRAMAHYPLGRCAIGLSPFVVTVVSRLAGMVSTAEKYDPLTQV